jgi:hypothetical protein
MKIEGGCHCGSIAYEADVDPEKVTICHCTDCQTLSGSAFRTVVPVPRNAFKLMRGQPKVYIKTAESGARRAQAFCPECGSPIYSAAASDTPAYSLRVGTIRQRARLRPKARIWCRSAPDWIDEIGSIKRFDKQPDTVAPAASDR